jgi:hypothetical protein
VRVGNSSLLLSSTRFGDLGLGASLFQDGFWDKAGHGGCVLVGFGKKMGLRQGRSRAFGTYFGKEKEWLSLPSKKKTTAA